MNRLRAILLRQGQRVGTPAGTQVGQQPHRARSGRDDCEPRRRFTRVRHRNSLWLVQCREDRRRVKRLFPLRKPSLTSSRSRYFTFLTECTTPKACTILLRGPSKDVLNEIDRNLADAMSVARNVVFNPTLVPGGGAVEMAISVGLHARARAVTGVEGGPYRAVADALEVIPRTLVQNAGGNAIRALTALRVRFSFQVNLNFSDVFFFYFRGIVVRTTHRRNMRAASIRGVSMARRARSST
jgi:hypothetical protein